jgi:hypothetical protein
MIVIAANKQKLLASRCDFSSGGGCARAAAEAGGDRNASFPRADMANPSIKLGRRHVFETCNVFLMAKTRVLCQMMTELTGSVSISLTVAVSSFLPGTSQIMVSGFLFAPGLEFVMGSPPDPYWTNKMPGDSVVVWFDFPGLQRIPELSPSLAEALARPGVETTTHALPTARVHGHIARVPTAEM